MSGGGNSVLFVHHRDISSSYSSTAPHYVSKELAASWTVHVVCLGRPDSEHQDSPPEDVVYHGIDTGSVPLVSGVLFHLLCAVYAAVLGFRHRYDAVYTFQRTGPQGWLAAVAGGSRFVVGLGSVPVRQKRDFISEGSTRGSKDWVAMALRAQYARLFRLVLRRADAVVCLTEGIRRLTQEEYRVDLSDAHVIGMGVDLDAFTVDSDRDGESVRAANGTDDDTLVVTYVGSIGIVRGLGTVIEAMAETDRHVEFWVAGDGDDEAIGQLKARAAELGVSDRVEWFGFVPHGEVPDILADSDVAVSPLHDIESFRVSFPGKLLEYMAAGTMVVASDIEAHRQLIDDGENGVLFDGSAEAMAEVVERYADDGASRRALERAARETAEAHTWDRIVARHERVLRGAPEPRGGEPVSSRGQPSGVRP